MKNNPAPVKHNRRQTRFAWSAHHFINRHPALDLANTVVYRSSPERREDRLKDFALLRSWSQAAGFETILPFAGSMQHVLAVRDSIDTFFRATTGLASDANSWRDLAQLYAMHSKNLSFITASGSLRVSQERKTKTSGFLGLVLHSALELALSPDLRKVKVCPGCGWLFLDRTRNSTKRWCITALCGNRDKTRRYYRRRRRRAGATAG